MLIARLLPADQGIVMALPANGIAARAFAAGKAGIMSPPAMPALRRRR
jgi:hypothetical protein